MDVGVVSDSKVDPEFAIASQSACEADPSAERSLFQREAIDFDYLLGQGNTLTRKQKWLR